MEVLGLCTRIWEPTGIREMTEEDRKAVTRENDIYARRALRVLAFAFRDLGPEQQYYDVEEVEQDLVCIARGKEPGDPETVAEVLEEQLRSAGEFLEEKMEECGLDPDEVEGPDWEAIKEHIAFVENNPLDDTAETYRKKAHEFLKSSFYHRSDEINPQLLDEYETLNWYHTLLAVKAHRGLCGFHEPATEDDDKRVSKAE